MVKAVPALVVHHLQVHPHLDHPVPVVAVHQVAAVPKDRAPELHPHTEEAGFTAEVLLHPTGLDRAVRWALRRFSSLRPRLHLAVSGPTAPMLTLTPIPIASATSRPTTLQIRHCQFNVCARSIAIVVAMTTTTLHTSAA